MPVSDVYDVDPLFPAVRFDGDCWRDMQSDQSIGRPAHPEFGIVFEIGRLLDEVRRDLKTGVAQ